MEARRHHLGAQSDMVVKQENLLGYVCLFSIQLELLHVERPKSLHSKRHPVVETGHARDLISSILDFQTVLQCLILLRNVRIVWRLFNLVHFFRCSKITTVLN